MKETLTLHNDINEVPLLGEWVEQMCEKFDLPMSAMFQLNLALEEAVVNVMNYAYPGKEGMPVWLTMETSEAGLVMTLEDEGMEFDPTSSDEPDLTLSVEERPIGGLGIFLVKNIMKEVKYERCGNRNVLKMIYVPQ